MCIILYLFRVHSNTHYTQAYDHSSCKYVNAACSWKNGLFKEPLIYIDALKQDDLFKEPLIYIDALKQAFIRIARLQEEVSHMEFVCNIFGHLLWKFAVYIVMQSLHAKWHLDPKELLLFYYTP